MFFGGLGEFARSVTHRIFINRIANIDGWMTAHINYDNQKKLRFVSQKKMSKENRMSSVDDFVLQFGIGFNKIQNNIRFIAINQNGILYKWRSSERQKLLKHIENN